jgi:hypothetical protein
MSVPILPALFFGCDFDLLVKLHVTLHKNLGLGFGLARSGTHVRTERRLGLFDWGGILLARGSTHIGAEGRLRLFDWGGGDGDYFVLLVQVLI